MYRIFSDKPSAPQNLEIKSNLKTSAALSWSAPRQDGGLPIINYRIEKRSLGAYEWTAVNSTNKVTSTRFTVDNLSEDTDYEFRILAENGSGISKPSNVARTMKSRKF